MISSDHPYYFLKQLFDKKDAIFTFSRYVYTPDSLSDERECIEVAGADISIEWLVRQIEILDGNQELAFHSKITLNRRTFHVPMLDFATPHIGEIQIDRIRAFLPRRLFLRSAFYNSGRSFHAYSMDLLTPKAWSEFMGRALLINPRDGEAIIDARWIGHRLIAGYCSLRFSNNSNQYRGMPKQVGIQSFLETKDVKQGHFSDSMS